jgi:hypothetical protein
MDNSPKLPDPLICKTKDIYNSRLWECLVDNAHSCLYLRISNHNFICDYADPRIFENH